MGKTTYFSFNDIKFIKKEDFVECSYLSKGDFSWRFYSSSYAFTEEKIIPVWSVTMDQTPICADKNCEFFFSIIVFIFYFFFPNLYFYENFIKSFSLPISYQYVYHNLPYTEKLEFAYILCVSVCVLGWYM